MVHLKNVLFAVASSIVPAATASADVTYTDLYTIGKPDGFSYASPSYVSTYHNIAAGQTSGYGISGTGDNHAILWTAAAPNGIDLNPAFKNSQLYGTNGTQQFGILNGHAAIWSGSAASVIELDAPPFNHYSTSEVIDAQGNQQVGDGLSGTATHAVLWMGSAALVVDLNPNNAAFSSAFGTDGVRQVGTANVTPANQNHAMLWNGTAGSAIDLNPDGFTSSQAHSIKGGQEIGIGTLTGLSIRQYHALLWNDSAASAVDLNPDGFLRSFAGDTDGTRQVGWASTVIPDTVPSAPVGDAILWNGSANNYINLGQLLPSNFTASQAVSINGNEVYGFATDTDGDTHAILWTVPEPTSLALFGLAGVGLLQRSRVRRSK